MSKECKHVPKGYVSNQPHGYDKSRPIASKATCARDKCIAAAVVWVFEITQEQAFYTPYKKESKA